VSTIGGAVYVLLTVVRVALVAITLGVTRNELFPSAATWMLAFLVVFAFRVLAFDVTAFNKAAEAEAKDGEAGEK
jgi:hypothetical protein